MDELRILEVLRALVNFHDLKTEPTQRMYKLLDDLELPCKEV